jgi:hypothetical protein
LERSDMIVEEICGEADSRAEPPDSGRKDESQCKAAEAVWSAAT